MTPDRSTISVASLRDGLKQLSPAQQRTLLGDLDPVGLARLERDFGLLSHDHQFPPHEDGTRWTTWLMLCGRGAGKTRAGAEWVRGVTQGITPFAASGSERLSPVALVGETEHDAREVMIEGVSGIMSLYKDGGARPTWIASRRRLEWPNGAYAQVFSAEDPDSLRGPQFAAAWLDELAKWRHAGETFNMLQFGLRLGERPRQVITTTPRPTALIKRLIDDPLTVVSRASTRANAPHLAPAFLDLIVQRYAGTQLGRQEIAGEIIEDRAGALWTRAALEACRVAEAPPLARIVVAVDPPASATRRADACGLIAAGVAENGCVYVLADDTVSGLSPSGWAAKAITLWRRLSADALVVEVNQGGDMVRTVIAEVDRSVPVTPVHATRAKWVRAEPVAALYEQGRVKHAGVFAALEDEMCDFGHDGLSSGRSPDRLDALVWAISALTFGARGEPRVRGL
jgi:phage terminase large subunit-like protein